MGKRSPLLAALAITATVLVWATAFPAIALALRDISPIPLASLRYSIAAVFALGWLLWRRPARMAAADFLLCLGCGVLGAVGYSVFVNIGQQTVSAGATGFLVKTESLWMAALAMIFLGERFGARAWGGSLLAFAGVGIIGASQHGELSFGGGAVFVLAAAFCSASGFVLQRKLLARYGPLHVAAIVFIAAALALAPWLPQAIGEAEGASLSSLGWVAFLGIFPTTVGQICWTYSLNHFGVARAGNFLYLVAPITVLVAWILAGETPMAATIFGGALILGGVLLVNTRRRQKPAETIPPTATVEACADKAR
jgi:drug/metabolite transporter (DMT)-like permease